MKQIFGVAMIMSGSFAGDVYAVSSFEYKKVDGISLSMSARFPEGHQKTDLSPCHQVREGLPPTILFHGTRDTTVPPENAERFERLMKEAGNHCVRVPFEGRRHSFFNGSGFRRNNTDADFNTTMEKSVEFLKSIGFVPETG